MIKEIDWRLTSTVKKLWSKWFIKFPVSLFVLFIGSLLIVVTILQVIFGIYTSSWHRLLLIIISAFGCLLVVWSANQIVNRIFKNRLV
jgi:hypothetical protein